MVGASVACALPATTSFAEVPKLLRKAPVAPVPTLFYHIAIGTATTALDDIDEKASSGVGVVYKDKV